MIEYQNEKNTQKEINATIFPALCWKKEMPKKTGTKTKTPVPKSLLLSNCVMRGLNVKCIWLADFFSLIFTGFSTRLVWVRFNFFLFDNMWTPLEFLIFCFLVIIAKNNAWHKHFGTSMTGNHKTICTYPMLYHK